MPTLQVRLSADEKAEVERLAAEQGLSLTAFTKLRLLGKQDGLGDTLIREYVRRALGDVEELLPGMAKAAVAQVCERELPGIVDAQVEAVLQERPAPTHTPVTAPLYVAPKPYARDCLDADLHGNGLCKSCGGSFFG